MIFLCHEIIPERLWVGGYPMPEDVAYLKSLEITAVVNLQSDADLASYRIQLRLISRAYDEAGIAFRRFPIADFDRNALLEGLPGAVALLEEIMGCRDARVYLHCTAGLNRAPTVAAAYAIRALGLTALQALEHVTSRRPSQPYYSVLEQYAESLGKSS